MSPYTLSVLMSSLAVGTITTLSSYHWFLAWMGLEINTLAMIPLMTKLHHPRATESATKYFLTQATASALILFSTIMNAWVTGEWTIVNMNHNTSTTILTVALAIKLGVAPFHLWLPDVLQGLNMMTCLILSTWQKLAPMALLILTSHHLNTNLLILMALMSMIAGGWGGLNQTQMRKIMAYSSIAHLGWMVMIMPFTPNLALLNLLVYIILTSSMFSTLMALNSTNMNKLSISWLKTPTLAALSMVVLMALGGLPPTSGFLPKWLILQEMTKQHLNALSVIMAMSALLSLFFYLRLSYTISLTSPPHISNSNLAWRKKNNLQLIPMMITLSMMMMPVTPMLLMMN
uniref:NADH-ubiquinone oxidoreductase chain 2 n=1 Tax=Hypselotriton orientalis TaxID=3399148 RepID=C0RW68_9SALA|nr:NADH dehydrogenase subunit 2 [Cynops orientalis]ACO05476.1 NADH dehydrogenase subunit 2 [Cynops orientalis]ACR18918.1 NADH dehydrogenase subunit 2 [Cynops orientalis]ANG60536.1 NADH dehydrogenase subunit 2 [Cynops orientalis]ASF62319.1 NADH dehydrogenase subunit 2 [Cynops orientalis]WAK99392.1 NADH dehydrogenase subunit 2 [Cynops orientalis]